MSPHARAVAGWASRHAARTGRPAGATAVGAPTRRLGTGHGMVAWMGSTGPRQLVTALLGVLLLVGCADGEDKAGKKPSASSSPSSRPSPGESGPAPVVGGPTQRTVDQPTQPMNQLEKPIATRLGRQVAGQGLRLDYLDCPGWDGQTPQQLTCTGYLDGVRADVRVSLTRSTSRVTFDAELQDGVLATRNLVRKLRTDGYTGVDCGERPAYRTVVGSELVCSVREDEGRSARKYLVAEVVDPDGTVEIRDY